MKTETHLEAASIIGMTIFVHYPDLFVEVLGYKLPDLVTKIEIGNKDSPYITPACIEVGTNVLARFLEEWK